MSEQLATYSFLPWVRRGIANKIASGAHDGTRATIPIDLKIIGTGISDNDASENIRQNIALYGPGDIVGIDRKNIVRSQPLKGITNFESNYLPYVEFYDEDFPWRYSPVAPFSNGKRLQPWLTLIVVKEDEWEKTTPTVDRPLPYFKFTGNVENVFPPFDQLWAWAHVHVNESLIEGDNKVTASSEAELENAVEQLENILKRNPDLVYSRIMCPRKLEPNTSYHAFLIPTYESGRLSGLGLEIPDSLRADRSAWAGVSGKEEGNYYPYYYDWEFSTGTLGDFEYLVGLLEPQPIDSRVGIRNMDVQNPGVNVPGIDNPELNGILRLGGALRIPFATLGDRDKEDFEIYDQWDKDDYPQRFQEGLASFINLKDDYQKSVADEANQKFGLDTTNEDDKDPLITAPLYGRWHALQQRLLKDREDNPLPQNRNWVHELNLDPRYRVPAGFGTGVVQENQEDYMEAAWAQVGDVLEANQKIRFGQFALSVSEIWYQKHIGTVLKHNLEKALQLMGPLTSRVLYNGTTVAQALKESNVPYVFILPEMRRMLHPGSELMKRLYTEGIPAGEQSIIDKINNGVITPAPPKSVPQEAPKVQDLADKARVQENAQDSPTGLLSQLASKYAKYKWWFLRFGVLLFIISLFLSSPWWVICLIIALLLLYIFRLINKKEEQPAMMYFDEENIGPDLIDEMKKSPDFEVTSTLDQPGFGDSDSEEAEQFKRALADNFELIEASRKQAREKPRQPINIKEVAETMYQAIDPKLTIPRLIYKIIHIPERIRVQMPEAFVEAMVYPEIDIPMYQPLKDISSELFLPNIQYVAHNSISLLETNRKFIESYMVGLNHEFARELLWREYPTDQRGSYFRQFWDASSHLETEEDLSEEEQKEKLRDITPLHFWSKYSGLGQHDNRKKEGDDEEVVLVLRGELLKKYPTAVVYAHKARWQLKKDGTPDYTKTRLLEEVETSSDSLSKNIKTPLYEAKVDPDIVFFGFDLTVEEVQGGTGNHESDLPGWFFIIKERPGEPQFGLDIEGDDEELETWADLSWKKVASEGNFIEINNRTQTMEISDLTISEELRKKQNKEDQNIKWSKDMNAAELAYILYQAPVMVAVHAAEMLPKT